MHDTLSETTGFQLLRTIELGEPFNCPVQIRLSGRFLSLLDFGDDDHPANREVTVFDMSSGFVVSRAICNTPITVVVRVSSSRLYFTRTGH